MSFHIIGSNISKLKFPFCLGILLFYCALWASSDKSPCEDSLTDNTTKPCPPCRQELSPYMRSTSPVTGGSGGGGGGVNPPKKCSLKLFFTKDEQCDGKAIINTTDAEEACFNNELVEREVFDDDSIGKSISTGKPEIDKVIARLGFDVPEIPYFRYFLPPKAKTSGDYAKYDIGGVHKYYIRKDEPTKKGFDTDFEFFEWPGLKAEQQRNFLESVVAQTYGCIDDRTTTVDGKRVCFHKHIFVLLSFGRPTSKFLYYPCNRITGTHIIAYGHVKVPHADEAKFLKDYKGVPTQKLYLSHGSESILKQYIQPVMVRNVTLMEMMKTTTDDDDVPDPNNECSGMTNDTQDFTALRTVLDFTFSTNQLILGMKCGILVFEGIMGGGGTQFNVHTAKLIDVHSESASFPDPVNLITSTVCCDNAHQCMGDTHIVAGYSKKIDRKPEDLKYLYVSFDRAKTFEKKFIAPKSSAVNLIQAMYRMYDRFDYYYRVLDEQTELEKSNIDITEIRQKESFQGLYGTREAWKYLNVEEKEAFARLNAPGIKKESKIEESVAVLTEIACGDTEKAMELAKSRIHTSREPHKDYDYTPDWVKEALDHEYKEFEENVYDKMQTDKAANFTLMKCLHAEGNPNFAAKCKAKFLEMYEEDLVVAKIMEPYTLKEGNPVYKDDPLRQCVENDIYFWKERVQQYNKKPEGSAISCLEIVSMFMVKKNVLLLCQVGYCKSTPGGKIECHEKPEADNGIQYAIFRTRLSPMVPIATPHHRSNMPFQCVPMCLTDDKKPDPNPKDCDPEKQILPIMVPVPLSTGGIVILNCDKVIYVSGNSGKTMVNAVFYYKKKDPTALPNQTNTDPPEYERAYHLEQLNVPPGVAMDPSGHSLLLAFSNYYAYGVLNYNREVRLIVGELFRKTPGTAMGDIPPGQTVVVPFYTNSGSYAVSLVVIEVLKASQEYTSFYQDRAAIRLNNIPISFYETLKPFYEENTLVTAEARDRHWQFPQCQTFVFSFKPQKLRLDVGETATVQVKVTDDNPLLPLGIYTNKESGVDTQAGLEKHKALEDTMKHDWNVTITATKAFRTTLSSRIDAFFGSQYTLLEEQNSDLILINQPTIRCQVQPSASVAMDLGCQGKRMISHEDEFRPQCKFTFVNNFNYTLKKGQYDPDLARYWIENNPDFVRREANGDLTIVYDYTTFGCPIEPYQERKFFPDLRVLTEETGLNGTRAKRYNQSYVLIEMFGATGYNYTWKVGKDANCKGPHQTRKKMIRDWVIRRRIFNITRGRMNRWMDSQRMGDPDESRGTLLINSKGVDEHVNIWNRVNYQHCNETHHPNTTGKDQRSKLEAEEYEIMNNRLYNEDPSEDDPVFINRLQWETDRPKIFMFLAVAVDDHGTFCNYFTWFGVSLPKADELSDLASFLCFIVFALFWLLLGILGYIIGKKRIQRQYIREARAERLRQAAWTVIYRYEKLLHESENKQLEDELTDFHQSQKQEALSQKQSSVGSSRGSVASQKSNLGQGSLKPTPSTSSIASQSSVSRKKP